MKISACDKDGIAMSDPKPFEVMLNPEYYSVKSTINYAQDEQANGNSGGNSERYTGQPPRELTLAPFILDVTGAVPHTLSALYKSMKEVIDHLENVVYNVNGNIHESHIILIEWGDFSHKARLKSMDVKYTLFAENGDALRAEVSLSLMIYENTKKKAAIQKPSSPDLTHLIEVKDGDTLPLMCNRVYKDCSYYREVAEVNGLDDFCHLTPGTFLYFPPLVD